MEGEGALSIGTLTRLTSPVFLSTTADGRVVHGLAGVPSTGPVLLIGNHQLFAPDMAQLVSAPAAHVTQPLNFAACICAPVPRVAAQVVQFLKEKQRLVRGLAHPFIFGGMQVGGVQRSTPRARA